MILVHDISYHQGELTKYWPLFLERGCAAIICQSSNGLAYQNYFHYAVEEAKEYGFMVGSYHYYRQHILNSEGSYVPCNPVRQAENYYNWVMKSGIKMDLPPALDVEKGGNPDGVGYAGVMKCLETIEQLFGRVPMIYSSPSILKGLAKEPMARYPLWLAHYTTGQPSVPQPWTDWTLWQYSDKVTYTPPGSTVKKPIDHNYFNGDIHDLEKFCDSTASPYVLSRVRVRRDMASAYLRFRSRPELYAGTTLVVGRGDVLTLNRPEKVQGDIEYWYVELDGYMGYVSAHPAYTEPIWEML